MFSLIIPSPESTNDTNKYSSVFVFKISKSINRKEIKIFKIKWYNRLISCQDAQILKHITNQDWT